MRPVEKELTSKNVEFFRNSPEYAGRQECELKLVARDAATFEAVRQEAELVEQVYLSRPNDEFSLCVRKRQSAAGPQYTATLKDRGEVTDGARRRLEVECAISPEAYEHYAQNPQFPHIKKWRYDLPLAEAPEGSISIDFIEGLSQPVIEIESPDAQQRTLLASLFEGLAEDKTGDISYDNESLAYLQAGIENEAPLEALEAFAHRVVKEAVSRYVAGYQMVTVGLSGMSGSGKTTVTRIVGDTLSTLYGEPFRPTIISTDDYHRGKTHLEEAYGAPWTQWDSPLTYDTATLASDLELLAQGVPIARKHFDFQTEEPVVDGEITPSSFVIIEGLYAGSPDLQAVRTLHFELPTGIATSVGRDIRRLIVEKRANRAFPTPESRLQYQLEQALPLYLSQKRPTTNPFSASSRAVAERAFMLGALKEA